MKTTSFLQNVLRRKPDQSAAKGFNLPEKPAETPTGNDKMDLAPPARTHSKLESVVVIPSPKKVIFEVGAKFKFLKYRCNLRQLMTSQTAFWMRW